MLKRYFISVVAACAFSVHVYAAKVITPQVTLNSIKQIHKTERHGDELYISVTSFPSKGRPYHNRYPNYPLFWPGRNIDKVKHLKLWNGGIENNHGVRLLISLIEQDSPPWDIDDEIGSVDLKLHNSNGKLEIEWQRPNKNDNKTLSIDGIEKDIIIGFSGKNNSYEVSLKIKN